jgi:hypothetical protein
VSTIKRIRLPRTRFGRILLGSALVLGGLLGFLPILGFWMLPLGLWVLSIDLAVARRIRRRWAIRLGRNVTLVRWRVVILRWWRNDGARRR